ncbi:MAG: PhoH family protein [Lentisphaeria bacterium]|nr:PhoH family protein [Lentisphaeria bacterium]
MTNNKKIFVLDTNVILHDSSCIRQFQDNDVMIPITVLEELDQFKKGNGALNYHARQFLRELDALSSNRLFNGGLPIGEGLGRVRVRMDREFHEDLVANFPPSVPDHLILNTAYHCAKDNPGHQVTLVTKDVNLRMKAKSVGLMGEDYTTDHVKDISILYRGIRTLEDIDDELVSRMYGDEGEIEVHELGLDTEFAPNEYVILRSPVRSALACCDGFTGCIRRVHKEPAYGIMPRNAEQTFALDALTHPDIRLVTLSGKAGTGKTLLALAGALACRQSFRQIFLGRPVVPLSNKDIGFLPGDIQSKLNPYMQPLYDNLGVIKDQAGEDSENRQKIDEMQESEKLKIAPLSYIRGRSLLKIFFIVDEAQNLTPHEVKTIITRAGAGTKFVFTGDIYQIDHPYLDKHSNGLTYLIEKMHGQNLYAHVNLVKGERSELAELASNLL